MKLKVENLDFPNNTNLEVRKDGIFLNYCLTIPKEAVKFLPVDKVYKSSKNILYWEAVRIVEISPDSILKAYLLAKSRAMEATRRAKIKAQQEELNIKEANRIRIEEEQSGQLNIFH